MKDLLGNFVSADELPNDTRIIVESIKESLTLVSTAEDLHEVLMQIQTAIIEGAISKKLTKHFEIVFPKIDIKDKFSYGDDYKNICPIFVNSSFEQIEKNSIHPIKFFNCEITRAFTAKSKIINCEFNQSKIEFFLMSGDWATSGLAYFKECEIGMITVSENLLIRNLRIEKCKIDYATFGKNQLDNVEFVEVEFIKAPGFIDSTITKSVTFHNCIFNDNDVSAIPKYRELRHLIQKNNDEVTAAEFGALERRAKHKILLGTKRPLFSSHWWDGIVSSFYGVINDFGLNTYKPLKILFINWYLSFWLFFLFAQSDLIYATNGSSNLGNFGKELNPYWQSFLIASLSNSGPLRVLGKFDGLYPTIFFGEVAYWVVSVFSSLIWFFLIIGIRNRYKLS